MFRSTIDTFIMLNRQSYFVCISCLFSLLTMN